jgi:hypothetical protein
MAQHDFAKGIPVARMEDERFLTGRGLCTLANFAA